MLLKDKKFKASVNRSYYAIFHALRSVTALDRFDSSKHSGIIAYFNRTYIKNGVFDKSVSKMIDTAFRLREKADYQDFVVISREQYLVSSSPTGAKAYTPPPYSAQKLKSDHFAGIIKLSVEAVNRNYCSAKYRFTSLHASFAAFSGSFPSNTQASAPPTDN